MYTIYTIHILKIDTLSRPQLRMLYLRTVSTWISTAAGFSVRPAAAAAPRFRDGCTCHLDEGSQARVLRKKGVIEKYIC